MSGGKSRGKQSRDTASEDALVARPGATDRSSTGIRPTALSTSGGESCITMAARAARDITEEFHGEVGSGSSGTESEDGSLKSRNSRQFDRKRAVSKKRGDTGTHHKTARRDAEAVGLPTPSASSVGLLTPSATADKVHAGGPNIEARRASNIKTNQDLFDSMGLGVAVAASSSSYTKNVARSRMRTTSTASTAASPSRPAAGVNTTNTDAVAGRSVGQLSSPTRGSAYLQKNDILLVFGGPIHCTDPINADTCYLLLPLSSKGIASLVFWPGNRTSY
jgi:hypothetical protein